VSEKILANTGLDIDFNDCRVPTHDTAGVRLDFAAVERSVRERLDVFGAELDSAKATVGAVGA